MESSIAALRPVSLLALSVTLAARARMRRAPSQGMPGADPNDHDRFFVRRRFRLSGNRYDVATLAADAKSPADQVCCVEQKGLSLTEDMRAYTDDSKTSEVFRIREHQLLHYDVTDASGVVIGQLAKPVRKSLLRSTWRLHDPEGNEIGWAQDRSLLGSLIRRMIRLIPIVGEFRLPVPVPFRLLPTASADRWPRAPPRLARPLPPRPLSGYGPHDRPSGRSGARDRC
jgi:hypothetical protein